MNREGNFVFHYSCSSAVKLSSTTQCNNSSRRREVITAFAGLYARSHKTVLFSYLSLICRKTSNFQIKVMKHMLVNTQFKDYPSPWQIQNCVIFSPMKQKSILSNTTGDENETHLFSLELVSSQILTDYCNLGRSVGLILTRWIFLEMSYFKSFSNDRRRRLQQTMTSQFKRLRVFSNLIADIPISLKCQL